jgi:hypothetical protein
MNFLAGLILIGCDHDEVVAFTILNKLMRDPGEWSRLYSKDLEYLFPLTDHVYSWLLSELPQVEEHFSNHDIPLATLLAGPFMALFATIVDFDIAM